jgi:hypothetical protein
MYFHDIVPLQVSHPLNELDLIGLRMKTYWRLNQQWVVKKHQEQHLPFIFGRSYSTIKMLK